MQSRNRATQDRRILLWALSLLLSFAAAPGLADDPGHHQVLILHSYHQSYSWTANIHAALVQNLQPAETSLDIRTEYLDVKHYPAPEMLDRHADLFLAKYGGFRFDVVLTSDNAAFRFALQHRDRLFPGVPIVFCGVNGWRPGLFGPLQDVTGVAERLDPAGTLALALKVHPGTQRVLVVCDETETGLEIRAEEVAALARQGLHREIEFIGGEETWDLVQRLEQEPPTSLILITLFSNDARGRFQDLWELADTLRAAGCRAPVWTLYEEALGHGVVGGHLQSGASQGALAAGLARRILGGERAASIPILDAPTTRWVFDDRELRRFGIDDSLLPPGSEVRYAPPGFYHRYRTWILGSLLVLLLGLAGVIAWSMELRRIVRQRTAKLREELAARQLAEANLGRTVSELQQSLAQVKHLSGLIPICAHCKKIRSDEGYWEAVEQYITERSEAQFSHGICPECLHLYFPDIEK